MTGVADILQNVCLEAVSQQLQQIIIKLQEGGQSIVIIPPPAVHSELLRHKTYLEMLQTIVTNTSARLALVHQNRSFNELCFYGRGLNAKNMGENGNVTIKGFV